MAKKQSFLHGTVILAAAVAIVKVIGALFKIPIINLLGGSGYGHFTIAYNVYTMLLVLSTTGLPVAVSKMVAEANARGRVNEIKKTVRVALSIFLVVGFIASAFMFIFARQLAAMMGSPDSAYTIMVIAPACFFVAVMSVFRGYYQGITNMYPTAVSQIIEALSKLIIGYGLAYWLIEQGYTLDIAAAGAIAGVSIGTALGALYMVLRSVFDRNPPTGSSMEARESGAIAKELLTIAIPIIIGAGVIQLTSTIDTMFVMRRLQDAVGFTEEDARWLFGSYGLAQTMFSFPPAFIVPFSVSVVPAIAAAMARGDNRGASNTVESAMRLTSILALPAAAGLLVLAGPILNFVYSPRPEEAAAATLPLTILAVPVFFNCVVMLSNAVLQSVGKVRIPIYTMLAGAIVKIAVSVSLVGIPEININGAPVGTLLCYATIMVLNLIFIAKYIKPAPRIGKMYFRPAVASVIMAGAAWASNGLLCRVVSPKLAVILAIGVAVVIYLVLIITLRAVTREDMLMLPKGDRIAKLLRLK